MNTISSNIIRSKFQNLMKLIMKYQFDGHIGILSGSSGIALVLFEIALVLDNEEYFDKAAELLNASVDSIDTSNTNPYFSSGLAGFGCVIQHLINRNILEDDSAELLENIDELLWSFIHNSSIVKEYDPSLDYLHGIQGISLYYLFRNKKHSALDILLKHVEYQAIEEDDGSIKWIFVNSVTGASSFNFSLSHGMASIIAILSKYYQQSLYLDRVIPLLRGAIKFLLKHRLDQNLFYSHFPNGVEIDTNCASPFNSRMAWCYGDPGIASVLYKTGNILKDQTLLNLALDILKESTNRRFKFNAEVKDAGFCHGTIGLELIYKRAFDFSKDKKFEEASNFWALESFKYANREDGLAGFKPFVNDEKYDRVEYGFLEGISGIAYGFCTQLYPNTDVSLLELFLI